MNLEIFDQKALNELALRDEKLKEVIEIVCPFELEADTTFFRSIVHQLFKQQISTALAERIWKDFCKAFPSITPQLFATFEAKDLEGFGISKRRMGWIILIAKYLCEHPDFEQKLWDLSTDQYFKEMVRLPGIGIWTAEMIGIFYFQKKDIFSYGDFGIHKGLQMIYGMEGKLSKEEFAAYQEHFSPHLSLASLLIWRVAEGYVPQMTYQKPVKVKPVKTKPEKVELVKPKRKTANKKPA